MANFYRLRFYDDGTSPLVTGRDGVTRATGTAGFCTVDAEERTRHGAIAEAERRSTDLERDVEVLLNGQVVQTVRFNRHRALYCGRCGELDLECDCL